MPLGKSGRFHMNPYHMRAVGDAPDDKGPGDTRDAASAAGKKGDGKHHHEMTQHEDGSYSSTHTHPDGHKEHAEHPSFQHAQQHEAEMMGEEGSEHQEPDGDEGMGGGGESSSSSSALESMYK